MPKAASKEGMNVEERAVDILRRRGWVKPATVKPPELPELKPEVEEQMQRPLVVRIYRKTNERQPELKLEQFAVNSGTRQLVKARANLTLSLLLGMAEADPNLLLDTTWQAAVQNTREISKRYG
jgi:hypothetical protein